MIAFCTMPPIPATHPAHVMRPQMDAAQNKAARSDARTSPSVPPGTEGGPSGPSRKHGSNADVAALADGASLLTVLRASQKKPGAPKKGTAAAASDAGLSIALNWAAGGFTPEAIQARADFDTRRINVSQKETQGDVLQATKLIINGAPTSVTSLRAFRPRSKSASILAYRVVSW